MAGETFFWGGQWWQAGDKAAFAKWLHAHGANFSTWAAKHPKVATRVFGGGAAAGKPAAPSLVDIASKQYDASIAPSLDALNKERARSQAEANSNMANIKGMYAALAGMLGSVGPSISNNYQAAANTELAAGRGFGDQEAARGIAEGDKAAGYLTTAGAPQAAIEGAKAAAGGTNTGDLVYGQGGYIPATTTAREGAAFASAGAMLPGTAVGRGQDELRSALADAMKNDASFGDKIAELQAGRPEAIQKLVSDMIDQQRQDRALHDQEIALGIRQRTSDATITGVDPVTGKPTAVSQRAAAAARAKAAAAAKAAKSKDAATRAAGIKAREDAFASARQNIFSQAAHLPKAAPMTKDDIKAWIKSHPGADPRQMPATKPGTSYTKAKTALFNQYKDLLRYATASGRPALKRRLNQMIDEALAAAGIHPPAPKPSTANTVAAVGSVYGWGR